MSRLDTAIGRALAAVWRPPRAWQVGAMRAGLAALLEGRRGLVYAATGAGKSDAIGLLLSGLAPSPGWVDVVVVPTQNLVRQTVGEAAGPRRGGLRGWGLAAVPWYQGHTTIGPDDRVIVACRPSVVTLVDQLVAMGRCVRCLVIDEAHGLGEDSRCRAALADLEERCTTEAQRAGAGIRWIGFTATPQREDMSELAALWPAGVLLSYSMADAIRDGVIMRPDVIRPESGRDAEPDAEEADQDELTIQMIQRYAEGPTVCDAATIGQAREFADLLTRRGIPAAAVWGSQKQADTEKALDDLRAGRIRVVVHVKLLSEGVDMPWLRTMVIRIRTGSMVRWVQMVGRVVRVCEGKDRAVLIDVRNQWHETFGFPVFDVGDLGKIEERITEEKDPLPRTPGALAKRKEADPVRLIKRLEGWLIRLVGALEAAGVIEPDTGRRDPTRYARPTPNMVSLLRRWADERHKSPARHLPETERERWHALCASADQLTAAGASDAIRVGISLNKQGGEYYRQTGRSWGGAHGVVVPE